MPRLEDGQVRTGCVCRNALKLHQAADLDVFVALETFERVQRSRDLEQQLDVILGARLRPVHNMSRAWPADAGKGTKIVRHQLPRYTPQEAPPQKRATGLKPFTRCGPPYAVGTEVKRSYAIPG